MRGSKNICLQVTFTGHFRVSWTFRAPYLSWVFPTAISHAGFVSFLQISSVLPNIINVLTHHWVQHGIGVPYQVDTGGRLDYLGPHSYEESGLVKAFKDRGIDDSSLSQLTKNLLHLLYRFPGFHVLHWARPPCVLDLSKHHAVVAWGQDVWWCCLCPMLSNGTEKCHHLSYPITALTVPGYFPWPSAGTWLLYINKPKGSHHGCFLSRGLPCWLGCCYFAFIYLSIGDWQHGAISLSITNSSNSSLPHFSRDSTS